MTCSTGAGVPVFRTLRVLILLRPLCAVVMSNSALCPVIPSEAEQSVNMQLTLCYMLSTYCIFNVDEVERSFNTKIPS